MDALDVLLKTIGGQAFKYVVNSGISLTSGYAVHQCARLIKAVDDQEIHAELKALQKILDNKVKVSRAQSGTLQLAKKGGTAQLTTSLQILSPAIDLIEFK